jgi:hypothetical protein
MTSKDPTAAARVKRWRARQRGEPVPHHKAGRRPVTRKPPDDFVDLNFIALALQRLENETNRLRQQLGEITSQVSENAWNITKTRRLLANYLSSADPPSAATRPQQPIQPPVPDIEEVHTEEVLVDGKPFKSEVRTKTIPLTTPKYLR